jgi:two-component system sensor histidine kinase/response regulator
MPGNEDKRASAKPGGRALRVLVAEDNEVNRVLAVRLLANCGHDAVLVGTGSAAVEAWEAGGFDLILMDLQMPQMDGFEATLAIREGEKAKGTYIPIIALTANAASTDEARCLAAGMDAFISKPVSVDVFCEVIASVLEKRGVRTTAPDTGSAAASSDVFDLDRALEAVSGERELLHGMIGIFMRQTPRVMQDIDTAIAGGDAAALESAAHKLKGSVAMFGAQAAREAAQRLEDLAEARDLADVGAARLSLGNEIERLQTALGAVASGDAS